MLYLAVQKCRVGNRGGLSGCAEGVESNAGQAAVSERAGFFCPIESLFMAVDFVCRWLSWGRSSLLWRCFCPSSSPEYHIACPTLMNRTCVQRQ